VAEIRVKINTSHRRGKTMKLKDILEEGKNYKRKKTKKRKARRTRRGPAGYGFAVGLRYGGNDDGGGDGGE
jgi:hypothetical protein